MGDKLLKNTGIPDNLEQVLAGYELELKRAKRQLEIEEALDKIRERATNMRNSSELAETSAVLFEQLKSIGIRAIRTSVGIFDDANEAMELWTSSYAETGEVLRTLDYVNLHVHEVFKNILTARRSNQKYAVTRLEGNAVRLYYDHMSIFSFVPQREEFNDEEYYYSFFFAEGALNVVTSKELSDDECTIMIRFAHVFGLIYTRFLDLQKAEAQTHEAQVETALERVRTRTMAMQKSEEIAETTKLLFEEFSGLGEAPARVSIGIINEAENLMNIWTANYGNIRPDEIYQFPLSEPNVVSKMYDAWKKQKRSIIIELEGGELEEYFQFVSAHGVPVHREDFGSRRIHNAGIFSKGIISFITPEPRPESSIVLLEKFASVFDLTYTRFQDLKLAEAQARQAERDLEKLQEEKKNTEKALTDLKATQAQLVQAEKMASLGELTAGIAHEIKNPLNFVNNFAEVNKDLIEELKEELEAGNKEEVIRIVTDISENEDKIIHHGKRADAIVKSMLQHSRTGSGKKELTDLNELCDEYLRLAYHGLRAKDKSFNAKFETHLELSLPKIEIVAQDIGRVILNLINNAFYAASSKARALQDENFVATVMVGTHLKDNMVLISVKDNGNGIPEKDIRKIFHPFFTTKPAGEGTGLGLSLSYDIIKSHGGDIKVESSPGRWCRFFIELPLNDHLPA
jgi:signal transduction histidine kinase